VKICDKFLVPNLDIKLQAVDPTLQTLLFHFCTIVLVFCIDIGLVIVFYKVHQKLLWKFYMFHTQTEPCAKNL